MNSINGRRASVLSQQFRPESLSIFNEGISLILAQWSALQLAIQNEWGGTDSCQKSEELAADLFSWFSSSKVPFCVDDLESLLHESMVFTFNTDIEDGSIEEVAEALMILYEECLQRNYESMEKLRKSRCGARAVPQTRPVVSEDDDKTLAEEASVMVADEPKQRLESKLKDMSMTRQKPRGSVRNEDVWPSVVTQSDWGFRA